MPVKVVVKGKKEPEKPEPLPASAPEPIRPVQGKKRGNSLIITRIKKMFNIMKLDIRMKFNKNLKKEYEDYARFAELARRGMK